MTTHYINFGFPNTVVGALVGFNLQDNSPVTGVVRNIIIDSPSEFMGIQCFIDEIMILPQEGEITIRQAVKYPVGRKINQKQRIIVSLDNHDPLNPHTPSIVWEIDDLMGDE